MQSTSIGYAVVRITTGMLLFYHGLEIFDETTMAKYASWESLKKLPFTVPMTYAGKAVELIGGLLLAVGLWTRVAASLNMGVMLFICFYLGKGKFWYEDQHPFLFALLCLLFAFAGEGKWSVGHYITRSSKTDYKK